MSYAEWNNFTTYATNDIVAYVGNLYISLQTPNLNQQPDTSPTFWAQIGGGSVVSSIVAGGGISVGGSSTNPIVSTNITSANAGLTITSGVGTNRVYANTGVLGLTAGSGIGISGANDTGLTVSNSGVLSVASQTGAVSLTSTGGSVAITTPTSGTINFEATTPPAAGVVSLNTLAGAVNLQSSGATIAITTPGGNVINLEQSGGTGTLTGITAGTGIAVSGVAPSPTITNTGTLDVYGGIGITIAGPSTGPTVNNSGVLTVLTGKGVRSSGGQNPQLSYIADQAFVDNPNFILMDPANNGFVDGRGAPLNAFLIQQPGTYYVRATAYEPGFDSDLQVWALIQTGTTPGPGAVITPSGGIYTIFNANPLTKNNFTNLNFSFLRDNTFSPGLTSPLGTPQQLSPNQSVSFMVNYLPSQGAGGTAGSTTQPVITWLQKNAVSGVPY